MAAMAADRLGIEIGGTKIQAVRGDGGGRIDGRRRLAVDRAAGAAGIRRSLAAAVRELFPKSPPAAVGVGFGGPVDALAGRVARSHHVDGWEGFALREWLRGMTGCGRVAVDNDANVAALAEARLGAGREVRRVFYVTLGSGMGGGMVVDGGLYHGAPPGECEIGLMPHPAGGNFESHCSGWAVDRRCRSVAAEHPGSPLAQALAAAPDGGGAAQLGALLAAGDADAAGILDAVARDLALALALVAHLFHPEMAVLGGGLSLLGEPLRADVARHLPPLMSPSYRPGPEIRLAGLGEDVVPIGALLLAEEATA